MSERLKAYRKRHKELGLCRNDSRPATQGVLCDLCYETHRAYKEATRKKKAAGIPTDKLTKAEKESIETQIHQEFTGSELRISTKSLNIQTLDDLITESKVDLETWEIVKHDINSWEVTIGRRGGFSPETFTNYQVKASFKPRIPDPVDTAIRDLIKTIPAWIPPTHEATIEDTPFALEMALYDAHFGKLAWGAETMQGSYDMEIAAHTFVTAARKCLDFASPYNVSKIFFPFGQDFMHIENYQGTTAIGKNVLDTDTRLPNVIMKSIEAMIDVVKLCRDVAPIEILWVPGNHDMHSSFYLSEILKQRFRADDRVVVDNTPPWRKARLWGNLLVGFTHDANIRQANVVNMLPQFFPKLWGESKFREWHTGHKHTKKEWKYMPTTSAGGTIIRQIPTLSPIDAWHYQEGFVDAVPGGESFLWSKDNGVVAHWTAHIGSHQPGSVG